MVPQIGDFISFRYGNGLRYGIVLSVYQEPRGEFETVRIPIELEMIETNGVVNGYEFYGVDRIEVIS